MLESEREFHRGESQREDPQILCRTPNHAYVGKTANSLAKGDLEKN